MKNLFKNKKFVIALAVVLFLGAAGTAGYFLLSDKSSGSSDAAYVTSVAGITGNLENGMRNRYAGIVESQETWSEENKTGRQVKEYNVNVGDAVTKDQQLLVYDTSEAEESLMTARIDLQRLQDELTSLNENLNELSAEKNEATDETTSAELTVEIQQKQLDIQSKNYDIQAKQNEITKLEETVNNSVVKSQIDGVVKSLGDGNDELDSTKVITIVNTQSFQIKARVNEQNLNQVTEQMPVIVFSRVDDNIHWKGTVSKVSTDTTANSSGNSMDEGTDSMTSSTNYPFYVSLESNEGLIMGQHVYIEQDVGQLEADGSVIELDEYMIVDADTDNPYVWADNGSGKLEKRSIEISDYNEETMKYKVKKGLKLTDKIAMPDDTLKEGAKTVDSESEEEGTDDSDKNGGEIDGSEGEVEGPANTEEMTVEE